MDKSRDYGTRGLRDWEAVSLFDFYLRLKLVLIML
jgi:hypothetical protein